MYLVDRIQSFCTTSFDFIKEFDFENTFYFGCLMLINTLKYCNNVVPLLGILSNLCSECINRRIDTPLPLLNSYVVEGAVNCIVEAVEKNFKLF